MSAKKIHVTVTMPWWERVRFLFSPGVIDILFEKTIIGPKVLDVRVRGRNVPKMEAADAQPH
jgi:hypothetical protein